MALVDEQQISSNDVAAVREQDYNRLHGQAIKQVYCPGISGNHPLHRGLDIKMVTINFEHFSFESSQEMAEFVAFAAAEAEKVQAFAATQDQEDRQMWLDSADSKLAVIRSMLHTYCDMLLQRRVHKMVSDGTWGVENQNEVKSLTWRARSNMTSADLRAWQAHMGYTYDTASKALGVARSTYATWISGERDIDKRTELACAAIAANLQPFHGGKSNQVTKRFL